MVGVDVGGLNENGLAVKANGLDVVVVAAELTAGIENKEVSLDAVGSEKLKTPDVAGLGASEAELAAGAPKENGDDPVFPNPPKAGTPELVEEVEVEGLSIPKLNPENCGLASSFSIMSLRGSPKLSLGADPEDWSLTRSTFSPSESLMEADSMRSR